MTTCCNCSNTPCPKVYDEIWGKEVYTIVDEEPSFNGGMIGITSYLFKNFKQVENKYHQSSFVFEFIIDIDGKVITPRIYNKAEKDLTEAEKFLLEQFKKMPKWESGKCKGKIVPVLVKLPLNVKLNYN